MGLLLKVHWTSLTLSFAALESCLEMSKRPGQYLKVLTSNSLSPGQRNQDSRILRLICLQASQSHSCSCSTVNKRDVFIFSSMERTSVKFECLLIYFYCYNDLDFQCMLRFVSPSLGFKICLKLGELLNWPMSQTVST